MLESQRLQMERAKLQVTINEMPEIRSDNPDAETRIAERQAKVTELISIDNRMVTALDTEDKEAQAAMARSVDTEGWTPELRERHALGQRTSIVNYMAATVQEKRVTGAEAEYNDMIFGSSWQQGDYPLEMLLDRGEYFRLDAQAIADMQTEQRTEITGVTAGSENESYIARLLDASDGAYLGASYPAVGPGRHSYPIVSGTTVASVIARATAEVPAGGLSIVNADPTRIQHSYEVAAVDELQMPGIMGYMASDLRISLGFRP